MIFFVYKWWRRLGYIKLTLINIVLVFFSFKSNLSDILKSMSFEDSEQVKDLSDVGSKQTDDQFDFENEVNYKE